MAFRKSADGVVNKGKTKGKNFGDDGSTVSIQTGGKGGSGGKTNEQMLSLGRNLAKVANQKGG